MDSLGQWPETLDDDIKPERLMLDAFYDRYGGCNEGSERARARWLIEYLSQQESPCPTTKQR